MDDGRGAIAQPPFGLRQPFEQNRRALEVRRGEYGGSDVLPVEALAMNPADMSLRILGCEARRVERLSNASPQRPKEVLGTAGK